MLNVTFPLNLTDPSTIPTTDPDPVLFPEPAANLSDAEAEAVISTSITQILDIISGNSTDDSCAKCVDALSIAQNAAQVAPTRLPDATVRLCQTTGFSSNSTCQSTYEASAFGAVWTQVLAKADVAGLDGRYMCASLSIKFCAAPPVIPKVATFPKEKPADVSVPARSGQRAKVFHISDLHLGKSGALDLARRTYSHPLSRSQIRVWNRGQLYSWPLLQAAQSFSEWQSTCR